MNTGPQEKTLKQLFVGKCWEYLNDNFHKFTETNKIKIALELCKKDIPVELAGAIEHTHFFENMMSKVDSLPSRLEQYAPSN